jgi:selenide,water dikinase
VLDSVLGKLARQHDPNVLIGFDTADDAGVYQLTPELALVQTVDFFTPIVDDPYIFGQIAATNALSDIYAMGGRPMSALALVCFPDGGELKVLEEMLAGGLSKMVEAQCTIIGGHSIRDDELKLGYAVTGTIHPQRILANGGAKVGDRLLLTKSIGTGVISTAIKRGKADFGWVRDAVRSMTTLNRAAAEVIFHGFDVHGMTDVTGFGLIGHAREMAMASGVSLRIRAARVPLLEGALECVRAGFVPGGLKANRNFVEGCVEFAIGVPEDIRTLLCDPQTAGGLLIAVAPAEADRLLSDLRSSGTNAVEVGEVVNREKPLIAVLD